jgi:hypothetical protein
MIAGYVQRSNFPEAANLIPEFFGSYQIQESEEAAVRDANPRPPRLLYARDVFVCFWASIHVGMPANISG